MTELELFWISGSPPSWRVMLALEVKGLAYASKRLDAAKREHKTPEFLSLNPRGQVPVVRTGALVVRESLAILACLERLRPSPPLLGANASEAAEIWQWIFDFENHLRPAITTIAQILFRDQRQRTPELSSAMAGVNAELPAYEARLARTPFLAGQTLTAADLVLYPGLKWMERAVRHAPEIEGCAAMAERLASSAALARLSRAIEALPGYARTYPPHWRES